MFKSFTYSIFFVSSLYVLATPDDANQLSEVSAASTCVWFTLLYCTLHIPTCNELNLNTKCIYVDLIVTKCSNAEEIHSRYLQSYVFIYSNLVWILYRVFHEVLPPVTECILEVIWNTKCK